MEFLIPEPFDVVHWTKAKAGKNPAGQVVYGQPVPRARTVRGFAPAGEQELRASQMAGRVITELVMLTAEGDWPIDSAVVLADGRRFEVNGPVNDYNLGPFGFRPGYSVALRRVNDGAA